MKLDRTLHPPRGKYALLNLRHTHLSLEEIRHIITRELGPGVLLYGDNSDSEFFVIKLKDKYAGPALHSYADAAWPDDGEYAAEVQKLAVRADNHPNKRKPD